MRTIEGAHAIRDVVVVFYRGGWCPYCNLHLRGFQRRLAQIRELGAQVVAISPQLPDNSLSTQEKNELAFPVLSDVANKIGRKFGIVFKLSKGLLDLYRTFGHGLEDANGASGNAELPVPATFLIDGNGTIRLPTWMWITPDGLIRMMLLRL